MLQNISPREYQKKILEIAEKKNTLVILPTGIGKTLIALMLSMKRMELFPTEKILFLAPTRPLAEQHLKSFEKHLPEIYADMQLFTGKVKPENRKKIWLKADIVFSTPQTIANDIKSGAYSLENVSLLIEDEAHRCLKNYDYVFVAHEYKKQSAHPRILGLTASPGSEDETIKEICKNLEIEAIELRTRDSEDVKPYLQKLNTELVKIDFPLEFKEIRECLQKLLNKKIEELRNRKLLFQPATKKNLLELQGRIIRLISSGNRNFNILAGVSASTQAVKLQYALELLETQTLESFRRYLQDLFEQAAQGKSRAVKQIINQHEFNKAYVLSNEFLAKNIEHPKLSKTIELILREKADLPKFKAIIFSQYRETVIKICRELNKISGINAKVFVGQSNKDKGGLTQEEQQKIIKEFSFGDVNILCATSIGEEGLDLPEVNLVLFYEPVPSAIRKIQRAGRTARLMPGKVIILITKGTRDEGNYWAAFHKERKMHEAIKNLSQEFNDNEEIQKKLI